MTLLSQLQAPLATGQALKIISGIVNYDRDRVAQVVRAADQGGATFVDIAADVELVKLARSLTTLPICVSAIVPEDLAAAVAAGADLVEIGNFDPFYAEGRQFDAVEVLNLTHDTRELLPDTMLSVTVPHTLALDEQVQLAEELVLAGADVIQTEGGTSSHPHHSGIQGLIEKATPTLAAAYAIARAVEVPVLCASGISEVTAPLAIAAGAAGVGVGSAVNKLDNELAMIAVVRSLRAALTTATAHIAVR